MSGNGSTTSMMYLLGILTHENFQEYHVFKLICFQIKCTTNSLQIYYKCTTNALKINYKCITNGLQMHYNCTTVALLMQYKCTRNPL